MTPSAALTANLAALHRALVASTGTATFATATRSTRLLATASLTALVGAAHSVASPISFVGCHISPFDAAR